MGLLGDLKLLLLINKAHVTKTERLRTKKKKRKKRVTGGGWMNWNLEGWFPSTPFFFSFFFYVF